MTAADVDLVAKEVRAVLAGPDARRLLAAMATARQAGAEPIGRCTVAGRAGGAGCSPCRGRAPTAAVPARRVAAAVVGGADRRWCAGGAAHLSVQICGNFLLAAGTDEQRTAVLPAWPTGR